jgi:RNA polymerase sigma factor for flagellar operon FliA
MNAEELFLQHLATIDRIAAFVCRRNHLSDADAEEFAQQVKTDLIDNDYAVIRKFEGRSAFPTYLTTVIQRLFYQYRVREWGKWRPSAEAKRLGDRAVTLERLLTRDGLSFSDAVNLLTTAEGGPTVAELESIYARLPVRQPRPVLVGRDVPPEVASPGSADAKVLEAERESTARRLATTIDQFIGEQTAEDKMILRLRFWHDYKAPEISDAIGMDQKRVYKRLAKLLALLRAFLENAGFGGAEIGDLLAHGEPVGFEDEKSEGARPSLGVSGDRKGQRQE